jgi:hypothetical protein
MLRGMKEMLGYSIHAEDADFGKVYDFLEWDSSVSMDRDFEIKIYEHYGKTKYWS